MPVLVAHAVSGTARTREIGARMATAIGANAQLVVVEKAGHALHLERPSEVAHELTTWLGAVARPRSGRATTGRA